MKKNKLYMAMIGNRNTVMGCYYPEDDWATTGIGNTQDEALDRLAEILAKDGYVGSYGSIEMLEVDGMIKDDEVYVAFPFKSINTNELSSTIRDAIDWYGTCNKIQCDTTQEDLKERESYKKAKYRKELSTAQMKVINQRKKIEALVTEFENTNSALAMAQREYEIQNEGTLEYHQKAIELYKAREKVDNVLKSQVTAHDNLEKAKEEVEKLLLEKR